jgi:hypothetical protein
MQNYPKNIPISNSKTPNSAIFRSFIISFVKKIPRTDQQAPTANHIYPAEIKPRQLSLSSQKGDTLRRKSLSMPDLTIIEKEARREKNFFGRHAERIL